VKGKLESSLERKKVLLDKEKDINKQINFLKKELKILEEMEACLLKTQEEVRKDALQFTEGVVTWGLREIFGDSTIEFKIDLNYRWGNPELNFLIRDGNTVEFLDVVDCEAGGVKDVVGIMLRFALILLNGKSDFPIILDEVGKYISREYQERFAKFLRAFSEKFNKQIILISHQDEIIKEAHKLIRFKLNKGKTEVSYGDNNFN
jgi:DNA repair ATPase RecN